jgi:hypothetical protein
MIAPNADVDHESPLAVQILEHRRQTRIFTQSNKRWEKTPFARAAFLDSRTAISAVNAGSNRVTQIVVYS